MNIIYVYSLDAYYWKSFVCKKDMLNITVRRLHHPSVHIHNNIDVKNINYVIRA